MPNFRFTARPAADLASFRMAQSTASENSRADLGGNKPSGQPAADAQASASLYGTLFCASCHAIQNQAGNLVGGDLAPELSKAGTKVNPEWLLRSPQNPQGYHPQTRSPRYHLYIN